VQNEISKKPDRTRQSRSRCRWATSHSWSSTAKCATSSRAASIPLGADSALALLDSSRSSLLDALYLSMLLSNWLSQRTQNAFHSVKCIPFVRLSSSTDRNPLCAWWPRRSSRERRIVCVRLARRGRSCGVARIMWSLRTRAQSRLPARSVMDRPRVSSDWECWCSQATDRCNSITKYPSLSLSSIHIQSMHLIGRPFLLPFFIPFILFSGHSVSVSPLLHSFTAGVLCRTGSTCGTLHEIPWRLEGQSSSGCANDRRRVRGLCGRARVHSRHRCPQSLYLCMSLILDMRMDSL